MKLADIHIRDPFILHDNGKYYLYGTRAANFGIDNNGFDVYTSCDLETWSEAKECCDSSSFNKGKGPNWAPEVHKYGGKYYMFATFLQENGLRGTYSLVADFPEGPFLLNGEGLLTPTEWECLDGTLYVSKEGIPYVVFCHEHTQIKDGTVCYSKLTPDLSAAVGEPQFIFRASVIADPIWIGEGEEREAHFITDGPFLFRNSKDELLMIWSSFKNDKYAEFIAKSDNGEITGNFLQLDPVSTEDGGHGMLFSNEEGIKFIMHCPNTQPNERPVILSVTETNGSIRIIK